MGEKQTLEQELEALRRENLGLKKQAFLSLFAANERCCSSNATNQSRKAFVEEVGHVMRSSLSNLSGVLQLLSELSCSREQREYVELALRETQALGREGTKLFDMHRVESGDLPQHRELFSLQAMLEGIFSRTSFDAHSREIELSFDIDSALPSQLYGDVHRVEQVMEGIVQNRVRYLRDRAAIAINVSASGYDSRNALRVCFSITDTGRQLAPQLLEDLNRYIQSETPKGILQPLLAGSAEYGLVYAIRLVKLLGGEIRIESSERGTTFYSSLPFEELPQHKPLVVTKEYCSILSGKKILLVEDDLVNRLVVTKVLEQEGVEVVSVEDGMQAVNIVDEKKFDAILMDIQMPVLDGFAATQRIREKEFDKRIPIIALTAISDRGNCLQAGMDDYLAKPLERSDLLALLEKYLTPAALVVHDNFEVVQLLVEFLVERGWRVTTAEATRQALYEASLQHFDIFLLHTELASFQQGGVAEVIRRMQQYLARKSVIVGIGDRGKERDAFDAFVETPLSAECLQGMIESVESLL